METNCCSAPCWVNSSSWSREQGRALNLAFCILKEGQFPWSGACASVALRPNFIPLPGSGSLAPPLNGYNKADSQPQRPFAVLISPGISSSKESHW